ncbi:mediator complex, subunit Med10 [Annulohypoxylon truncatum]|uniref:mediator complex, subunit Med10 n=1 Tax=Annulohypoxylon truncatum TaxID=327061 RepID=UPI002007F9E3|nr:mediator complex, subunit Med10 [Annulohypoxylon truncatum]KAI1212906.1 mediator complex, subunit Med10 [Annulohypoxylon truncatum]
MAPMARVDHDALEQQLKDTIQTLTNIMVQVTNYDTTSTTSPSSNATPNARASSRDIVANELRTLSANLQAIHDRALHTSPSPHPSSHPSSHTSGAGFGGELPKIPPELIQYVDNGRNPDIYTREFVELVRRGNQLARGKQGAFASFRDVLAGEMDKALPELREDTARVLVNTRGRR